MLKTSTCPAEKPRHPMMRGTAVSGGQQRRATWNTFAGIPCQVGSGKGYLERFCGDTVAGGQRGDATWNAFAGIPCQVGGREMPSGTLSQGFRARWTIRSATCHAFAGIPWQVDSGMRHLERFSGDTVAGGRQDETPGMLLRGFRARWAAGRCHLEHFCGKTVAGGQQGDAT